MCVCVRERVCPLSGSLQSSGAREGRCPAVLTDPTEKTGQTGN